MRTGQCAFTSRNRLCHRRRLAGRQPASEEARQKFGIEADEPPPGPSPARSLTSRWWTSAPIRRNVARQPRTHTAKVCTSCRGTTGEPATRNAVASRTISSVRHGADLDRTPRTRRAGGDVPWGPARPRRCRRSRLRSSDTNGNPSVATPTAMRRNTLLVPDNGPTTRTGACLHLLREQCLDSAT